MAIIALGVGFFTGLKACKPAFTETADKYLNNQNFFDFQLISTLGFEDEDVEILKDVYEVGDAEGSYSVDALISLDGNDTGDMGAKFLTISKNINIPSLVAGKMPSKGNECLGDADAFSKEDIGKKIRVSKSNKDETKDMLAYDTYTLTGLADSPLYMNYERGSTSIGDGTVAGFVMLTKAGFSAEAYTEIYVTLAESAYIFSDEYNTLHDNAESSLEEALKLCADRRYNSIIDAANEEFDKAQNELDEGKAEIESAEEQLSTIEGYISKGQNVLDKGNAYYDKKTAQYQDEQNELKKQLESYYEKGLLSDEDYQEQLSKLENAAAEEEKELAELEAAVKDLEKEFENGKQQLNDSKTEIADGKAQIAEGEAEIADAKKELESEVKYPKTYLLDRDTNIGYSCFDNDISIVDGVAKVFPIFFFLVAALVCMTTMSRMIEEQRTQIGILKALGYDRNQILGKYVFYSGSSALTGGVLGFFAGSYLFAWVIWEAYGMMYGFADIEFVIDWFMGGLALIAALLCSVGTTIYSCYHELSEVPAELIRPKSPPAGKRILLEKIPFIWKHLKFLQKVSIRNVFRYKKRFFMMVLGICGCTALLIAAFGVNDSVKNVVKMQYDEIFFVDYTLTFDHDMSQSDKELFYTEADKYMEDCLFLHTSSVDARENGEIKTINLVVKDKNQSIDNFVDLHNGDKKLRYPGKGEGIVNSNIANILNLKVGDELTVYNEDMETLTVKISGLCDNYVFNYLFITDETYAEAWGKPETNSAYVVGKDLEAADMTKEDAKSALNPHEVGAILMDVSNVSAVSVSEDFRLRIENIMKSLDYVILLIIACAGALAFIVLYNLTNINITERIREIATIKVLGFYPKETASYVFRENLILTAISAFVGLPLGKWLHSFVMEQIKVSLINFDVNIAALSYIYAVIGTFVFAMIVNLVMRRKLNKISMTESLKSVE